MSYVQMWDGTTDYFTLNFSRFPHHLDIRNQSDIAYFANLSITITPRSAHVFNEDLTSIDEILLALLSLLLLLIIEATIATFLLRARYGSIRTSHFALKQILDLSRSFNFRRLTHSRAGRKPPNARINSRLLILAVLILAATLLMEAAVLFMTATRSRPVSNEVASFRIEPLVTPLWKDVRFNVRASINRPCTAYLLSPVVQGRTRVNACVTTDVPVASVATPFIPPTEAVDLEITTDVHSYGLDHIVTVGNLSATFSARALFTLHDDASRLMPAASSTPYERDRVQVVHHLFLSYLFSVFNRAVSPSSQLDFALLNEVADTMQFSTPHAPDIAVLPTRSSLRVQPRRYKTRMNGRIPYGPATLRFAHAHFRTASAVSTLNGRTVDLFVRGGMQRRTATTWEESGRPVNLASMTIIVAGALTVLIVLHLVLRPVAVAQLARDFVQTMKREGDGDWVELGGMGREEGGWGAEGKTRGGEGKRQDRFQDYSDADLSYESALA